MVGTSPSTYLQMKLEVTIKGKESDGSNNLIDYGTKEVEFLISDCGKEEEQPEEVPNNKPKT